MSHDMLGFYLPIVVVNKNNSRRNTTEWLQKDLATLFFCENIRRPDLAACVHSTPHSPCVVGAVAPSPFCQCGWQHRPPPPLRIGKKRCNFFFVVRALLSPSLPAQLAAATVVRCMRVHIHVHHILFSENLLLLSFAAAAADGACDSQVSPPGAAAAAALLSNTDSSRVLLGTMYYTLSWFIYGHRQQHVRLERRQISHLAGTKH